MSTSISWYRQFMDKRNFWESVGIIIAKYSLQWRKSQSIQLCVHCFAFLSQAAKIIDTTRRNLFLGIAIARDITRWRTQNDGHDRHSNHAHPHTVWSVSDQSGKRVQRTGWKALLTSKTAMQLRAARPMCGSGTLIKRDPDRGIVLGREISIFALSFRLHRPTCIRVPCDVTLSPIVDLRSSPRISPAVKI